MSRIPTNRPPTPPGVILNEEFLIPLGLSQAEVARAINVSYPRLNGVVKGHRELTTSTALRLAKYLGTSPEFWINLQRNCDLYAAMQKEKAEIDSIEPVAA